MKAGEATSVRSLTMGKNNLAIEEEDTVANILVVAERFYDFKQGRICHQYSFRRRAMR